MARLAEKRAVIAGGVSGIGEATVKRFVEDGPRVAIVGINEERGKARFRRIGDRAMFVLGNHSRK